MLVGRLRNGIEEGSDLAVAGWRWWTTELAALIPESVGAAIQKPEPRIVVDFVGEAVVVRYQAGKEPVELARFRANEIDDESAEKMSGPPPSVDVGRLKTTIRLPLEQVLRRKVQLPRTAKRNLREILTHELERQSPIDPAQIYFDYQAPRRASKAERIDIELRFVKRDLIDGAVEICRSLGLSPIDVEFLDDRGEAEGTPFIVDKRANARKRLRSFLAPVLATVTVVFALSAANAALSRNQVAVDLLSERAEHLKAEAQAVEKLNQNVQDARVRLEFLGNAKQTQLLVGLLAEVTRFLPDDSWLFEFELNGREVRIRGYSPSASKLIEIFDKSPRFTNAQFRAPLVQGQAKKLERFDLSFDLREKDL